MYLSRVYSQNESIESNKVNINTHESSLPSMRTSRHPARYFQPACSITANNNRAMEAWSEQPLACSQRKPVTGSNQKTQETRRVLRPASPPHQTHKSYRHSSLAALPLGASRGQGHRVTSSSGQRGVLASAHSPPSLSWTGGTGPPVCVCVWGGQVRTSAGEWRCGG